MSNILYAIYINLLDTNSNADWLKYAFSLKVSAYIMPVSKSRDVCINLNFSNALYQIR